MPLRASLLILAASLALAASAHARGTYSHLSGRWSTYGGPSDPNDNNRTASGIPNTVPGIAVLDQSTLKGWWYMHAPNNRWRLLQQTDIGPAPPRVFDINPPAARLLGGITTDQTATGVYLGKGTRRRAVQRAHVVIWRLKLAHATGHRRQVLIADIKRRR